MKTIFKFHFKLIVKGWNLKISQVQSHSVTRKWLWIPCCLASKGREKETYLRNFLHFHCLETEVILFWKICNHKLWKKICWKFECFYRFHPRGHRSQGQGKGEVICSLSSSPFKIIRGYTSVQMFSFVTRRIRDRVYNLVSRRYWASILIRSFENDNQ